MPHQLPPDPALLSGITAFQNLPAAVVDWLLTHGELRRYAPGEVIITAGTPAENMMAVVSGEIQYFRVVSGQREPVFRVEAGSISGVLPYSRLQVIRGDGVAVGDTTLYMLSRREFPALEQASAELVQRLVAIMSDRARDEVRGQERDDKLRALGKLAAGLSHELNNPAAAIVRAAAALTQQLAASSALLQNLLAACPGPEAVATLTALSTPAENLPTLSALDRADQEDALADWLGTQAVPEGYTLAPGLLEAGLVAPALAPLLAQLPTAARPPALAWLESHLATHRLAHDIHEAGQRISALVGNVKTYSHMDRDGGREKLAVTTGLDSTLHIFAHALREKNVRLVRDYAPGLPTVLGKVGSLNQVWTNLIDNALDALPTTGGELTVRVAPQANGLGVRIIDNGTGIEAEVLAHLFEPFYTTKPAGEGTGLGLDIARRIVQEHGGQLSATSEPGRTVFLVWLPV
ncbi:MAG: sensor histidine kinase [Janthinobacterium lividum]